MKSSCEVKEVCDKNLSTMMLYNKHNGQEFNLVLEGRMLINIEGKEIILNQGDSIFIFRFLMKSSCEVKEVCDKNLSTMMLLHNYCQKSLQIPVSGSRIHEPYRRPVHRHR